MRYEIIPDPRFSRDGALEIHFDRIPNKMLRRQLHYLGFNWDRERAAWCGDGEVEVIERVINGLPYGKPVLRSLTKADLKSIADMVDDQIRIDIARVIRQAYANQINTGFKIGEEELEKFLNEKWNYSEQLKKTKRGPKTNNL